MPMREPRYRRVAYVAGPVNAIDIYDARGGAQARANFGTSYLDQFYALADRYGWQSLIITNLPEPRWERTIGAVTVLNLPVPSQHHGLAFHVALMLWMLKVRSRVVTFRADIVVLTAMQNYLSLMTPLYPRRWRTVLSLHCTLFPRFARPARAWKLLQWANARTIFRSADAIQAVSQDVIDQVVTLEPAVADRCTVFRPTYDPSQFAECPAPVWPGEGERFNLLFVGRAEENKGILDLIEAATLVDVVMPGRVAIMLCGNGSALDCVRERIVERRLGHMVTAAGDCPPAAVAYAYGRSHAVVVPTRSSFEEGYNKVCAEAILAGRPIITSAVCPAVRDVGAAAIEVEPDNVADYAAAIVKLAGDRAHYERLQRACAGLQGQYYAESGGYAATLDAAIQRIEASAPARPDVRAPSPGSRRSAA